MSWFGHNAFASHAYEWPALEIGVLLLFALFIALSKLARHANARQTKARTKARGNIGAHIENNEDKEIVVAITAAFVGNIHRGQRTYALGNR